MKDLLEAMKECSDKGICVEMSMRPKMPGWKNQGNIHVHLWKMGEKEDYSTPVMSVDPSEYPLHGESLESKLCDVIMEIREDLEALTKQPAG